MHGVGALSSGGGGGVGVVVGGGGLAAANSQSTAAGDGCRLWEMSISYTHAKPGVRGPIAHKALIRTGDRDAVHPSGWRAGTVYRPRGGFMAVALRKQNGPLRLVQTGFVCVARAVVDTVVVVMVVLRRRRWWWWWCVRPGRHAGAGGSLQLLGCGLPTYHIAGMLAIGDPGPSSARRVAGMDSQGQRAITCCQSVSKALIRSTVVECYEQVEQSNADYCSIHAYIVECLATHLCMMSDDAAKYKDSICD
ncbi:unnamed protein product [Merluccius merluccius]